MQLLDISANPCLLGLLPSDIRYYYGTRTRNCAMLLSLAAISRWGRLAWTNFACLAFQRRMICRYQYCPEGHATLNTIFICALNPEKSRVCASLFCTTTCLAFSCDFYYIYRAAYSSPGKMCLSGW